VNTKSKTKSPIRRIAISTGGGDAPGLNAVIRAAVLSALNRGWECVGIRDGYNGLLMPEEFPDGGLVPLTREAVRGITSTGGTIIGTTNRGNPLQFPVKGPDGSVKEVDRSDELLQMFRDLGIDALISIGGDGSLGIAAVLAGKGLRVIGVPKTIDNDLDGTVITFGFDTAVSFATESIDRLHSTADAHGRLMIVEVMGRYAGWIALNSGVSATADAILVPEIPYDLDSIVRKIERTEAEGQKYFIVVVAEGAKPKGGTTSLIKERVAGENERLGGVGHRITEELEAMTGREARCVVLGHLLRGGTPTTFDRLLALRFGAAAVRALDEGETGIMVALDPPTVNYVPLQEATRRMRVIPLDCDTMRTARDLGICFGD
jgi:ATP-dependent phosphofructokinase / diphosphate-dependent phosphofructokinase